jgi:DNA-binding response OmpR family regulator
MASLAPPPRICRILVVEDSFLMAEALCDLLVEHGCEIVGPAARLSPALELAAGQTIDGAFLDVDLAGEHCFPLADLLRGKGVPFVFLTGYGEHSVVPAGFGGVPMASKPFDPQEIVALLHRHFAPAQPG